MNKLRQRMTDCHRVALALLSVFLVTASLGCANRLDSNVTRAMAHGEYGIARIKLEEAISTKPGNRNYILSRERYLIASLADGYPEAAEDAANEMYDLLRTQGVNEDRTVAAVVINESVQTWKGEPFEQAMGYLYVALQKASLGQWDNARAAAGESLFMLKDFGDNEDGGRMTTEDIARTAAYQEQNEDGAIDAYFDSGYQPIETNFTMGYLLTGLSSQMIGRDDEARDNYNKAVRYNPALRGLTDELIDGHYNTVFVVDAGPGPRKVRYGPDNALARFEPRHPSDSIGLELFINGIPAGVHPVACDINALAQDHMWNNMEDVRLAKSRIGDALLVAGGVTVAAGAYGDSEAAAIVGLSLMLAGLISKASAAADLTHAELLPQRMYLVPAYVEATDSVVEMTVTGDNWQWGAMLYGIDPPDSLERVQLRLVRLPLEPTNWSPNDQLVYTNDQSYRHVLGDEMPYIFGGRCVREPSDHTLAYYQSRGNLLDLTLDDLRDIYYEEGLWWDPLSRPTGRDGLHVLEGGRSLFCPQSGTVGYSRLFSQDHPPYRPRGERAKLIALEYQAKLAASASGAAAGSAN